ncbi:MAG: hypothetical protein LQ351_004268 [Letrouitia transgressa]|nr:MAG: hypothetical protein LQ351_004268 [Letrouitia transgressa]
MAYESFLHSKGLSQVTLGATAGINSDGAAQLSAAPFTPSSLPYREPSEDVPPTSFGRSHSGSSGPGSTEDAPDLSMLGLRQSRSIWQQSNLNSGTTSKSRFFDRTSSTFGEENSMFSEKPSTEGSSSSPTLKENDRPSSKVDKTPSSCDSGTSARVFNFTPSKRLCSGHAFGSTYSKCDERSCILSSWSSFRGLSSSPATKSGERPSAGASKPKERPSTAGSVSPSSANDERPSTRDSDSPQTDGAPFPRSMLNPSAPKNTGNPLSGKLSGDTSLSPRSRNERQPSNSSSSASISSEDNGSPSSIGTLDLRSLEDVEPFDRSEASLIGRDENGNPGSEAARAGYYYRIR